MNSNGLKLREPLCLSVFVAVLTFGHEGIKALRSTNSIISKLCRTTLFNLPISFFMHHLIFRYTCEKLTIYSNADKWHTANGKASLFKITKEPGIDKPGGAKYA